MNEALIEKLGGWDGKQTQYLIDIYQNQKNDPSFFKDLVGLTTTHQNLQTATTWLIKHHYDEKQTIDPVLIEQLLYTCPRLNHWEAKLHVLQLLPHFQLREAVLPYVEEMVRKGLTDKKKFVKTWSFQGLYELSKYIPEMKEEVLLRCQEAMEIESASVKARVRKILQKLEN